MLRHPKPIHVKTIRRVRTSDSLQAKKIRGTCLNYKKPEDESQLEQPGHQVCAVRLQLAVRGESEFSGLGDLSEVCRK